MQEYSPKEMALVISKVSIATNWFFPEALDEYISEDNPIRFIDAFVDNLDLAALGSQYAVPSNTGLPP